jgi:two-component system alkaline phosphatase synthesis response regulator PhoP
VASGFGVVTEEIENTMAKKILAVDDERNIVRLIQVNLERHGYQVVAAYDGKEGLEKVASEQPDMLVLDVMMPYMDGFAVLNELRKNPATRELPVIMLTAKASDSDVFHGWKSGADCYLTKPFNPMELVTIINRIFQAQDEEKDDRFEI